MPEWPESQVEIPKALLVAVQDIRQGTVSSLPLLSILLRLVTQPEGRPIKDGKYRYDKACQNTQIDS